MARSQRKRPLVSPSPALLVTGGAGFIGSALVPYLLTTTDYRVINLDALTYAGGLHNLTGTLEHPRHRFVRGDVADAALVSRVLREERVEGVLHLAAESHVDRSIDGPLAFSRTNALGTAALLEAARLYWCELGGEARERFRFVLVSTDEVFGALAAGDKPFSRRSPLAPSSPYSASKAAGDLMAMAYWRTYGFPVLITNCVNNYGPRQHPEKLIPTIVLRALAGARVPIYGDGRQSREWLHVDDHVRALVIALERGRPGERYLFGGEERSNVELARDVLALLQGLRPELGPLGGLLEFVRDRPGHDFRYAVDSKPALLELGWQPRVALVTGLRETIAWYAESHEWLRAATHERLPERMGLAGVSS
jgi:dTDP-glucose 4,6-dehydratase